METNHNRKLSILCNITVYWSVFHFERFCTQIRFCRFPLVILKILTHWVGNSKMLTHFKSIPKNYFCYTNVSRKVYVQIYVERKKICKILIFAWKLKFSIIGILTMPARYQVWMTIIFVLLFIKNGASWQKVASSACNHSNPMSPLTEIVEVFMHVPVLHRER